MWGTQVQPLVGELRAHMSWNKWVLTPQLESLWAARKDPTCCNQGLTQPNKYIYIYFFRKRMHTINVTYECRCWPWRSGWDSVCQVFPPSHYVFPPFYPAYFGRNYMRSPTCMNYLEFFWQFVSPPSFTKPFNHLFMPVWTHSSLFSILSSNPLLLYLAQIVPAFALSSWLLCSFDELLAILFWSTSLQLGSIRCPRLTLNIYCLRHRVS